MWAFNLRDTRAHFGEVWTNTSGRGLAEYRYRRKDGVYRWFADHYTITRDATGQPLYWVGTVRDVTDLKQAREALQRSLDDMDSQVRQRTAELRVALDSLQKREELFRQMATTIRQVFWVEDAATAKILYVSPAYETIWGRTCESAYEEPTSWQRAIHPDDRNRVLQSMAVKRQQGDCEDEEYRIVRPDGTVRWVHDRGFPVRDATGKVFRIVGCIDDVTERKQLEREILEVIDREQLRIGQDLHDGLCQLLVGASLICGALGQELTQSGHQGTEKAKRLDELLTEAMLQARSVAKGLSPVGLKEEGLRIALQLLAQNVSSLFGTPCTFSGPHPVAIGSADAALHLYRIAQEAVTNAIKHAHPRHVGIELRSQQSKVTLTIEDDGTGFTDTPPTDRGMGMHIMRHRACMIGATLEVRRRSEGGTVVLCSWPIPQTTAAEPAAL
ncbi:MAG: hypothetical protein A3K19_11565 [Lentisphaerae bacterium RIFOXYB12_FULL_65_16]|nr:MAG: hypothetical protein A3K19_11565 [Lentisphaerae bacterium RIFOXYB12_FULL_65_16]